MATREENLKKINEELEKLSNEQLEQVSGGDMWDALGMYLKAALTSKRRRRSDQEHKMPLSMQG